MHATARLIQLSVVACKLDAGSVAPVADVVASAERLTELDLSWNPIRG